MPFEPNRAAIRFGCGLSPKIAAPVDVDAMLAALAGPDRAAERFPVAGFDVVGRATIAVQQAGREFRDAKSEDARVAARETRRKHLRGLREKAGGWVRNALLRRALAEDGFRERLAFFWSDHFTAIGRAGPLSLGYLPYVEDAIRPHLDGRFADMLKAVITHPYMLIYFKQHVTAGPNSAVGQRRNLSQDLNENLGRELIELHTLGVGADYSQADVRALAELLTGMSVERETEFLFRPRLAEPGAREVLGRVYGGAELSFDRVAAALEDLAAHPATAAHLARKLAVHFTGDSPDPDMVRTMAEAYRASDGNLLEVYQAMLRHPAAWHAGPGNVKQPIDFVGSSLRALGVASRHVPDDYRKLNQMVLGPMVLMGQAWGAPLGPDGWPEADTAWITPQRMAARLQWGMSVPFRLMRLLPDPRDFVETALGPDVPEAVRFAAKAAETRAEGVGLVLASPAFQRM